LNEKGEHEVGNVRKELQNNVLHPKKAKWTGNVACTGRVRNTYKIVRKPVG
jgi:hypothetical protein